MKDRFYEVCWGAGVGIVLGIVFGAAAAGLTGCVEDKASIAARYGDTMYWVTPPFIPGSYGGSADWK